MARIEFLRFYGFRAAGLTVLGIRFKDLEIEGIGFLTCGLEGCHINGLVQMYGRWESTRSFMGAV